MLKKDLGTLSIRLHVEMYSIHQNGVYGVNALDIIGSILWDDAGNKSRVSISELPLNLS